MSIQREVEGWNLLVYPQATSTNDLARDVAPWSAIRADTQTQGRGRHGRSWASGEGGLWLSCIIPAEPPLQKWEALPLAAGAVVIETLQKLGVKGARLRWPNDIMVGPKKLCGLLVERHNMQSAVIGMGINITNKPASEDPELQSIATTLSDLLPQVPSMDEITKLILIAIRNMHSLMESEGWGYYRDFLNQSWDAAFAVECFLIDGKKIDGSFRGVDAHGHLLLMDSSSNLQTLDPLKVALFREK